jgi:hypothetical protein
MRHPANEREAIRFLRRLGCRRSRWASFRQQFLGVLIVAVVIWALAMKQLADPREVGSAVAVATAIFALMQWRAAAQEKAVDAYDARTAALNDKIAGWNTPVSNLVDKHFPSADYDHYRQTLYCYIALDNLEFALERYENGSASAYTAAQEVLTFGSKLRSDGFRERSQFCIDAASYSPIVQRVYRRLTNRIIAARTAPPPRSASALPRSSSP